MKIRVLGARWKVHFVAQNDQQLVENRNAWGIARTSDQTLLVASHLSDDVRSSVLFHELMHVADLESGDDTLTESQVERVSRVLWSILRDNPRLIQMCGLGGKSKENS